MFDLLKYIEIGHAVSGLAFSEKGTLGVTPRSDCIYVFDSDGNLLNKVCDNGSMYDTSYCCGRFGFVSSTGNVYITDEDGKLITKLHVGKTYNYAITMREKGFVVCGGKILSPNKCAFFDFNGNKLWDLDVGGVVNGPSYYKGYWYIADWIQIELLVVKNGKIIKEIRYEDVVWDTAVCDKYLAVSTDPHLYLYDLSDPSNPDILWKIGGFWDAFQVTFSSNCKYIAVADKNNKKLKIFNIEGDLIFEKEYWDDVLSVAWKNNRIAVGTETDLFVYSTSPLHCFI